MSANRGKIKTDQSKQTSAILEWIMNYMIVLALYISNIQSLITDILCFLICEVALGPKTRK